MYRSCKGNGSGNFFVDIRLDISKSAYDDLCSYRQLEGTETCGVLLGVELSDGHYRINRVSEPCMKLPSHFGCTRDAERANEIIEREYEESNHQRVYIGEWHTHPEDTPSPSSKDLHSIAESYYESTLPFNFLILSIVGINGLYWGLFMKGRIVHINPEVV